MIKCYLFVSCCFKKVLPELRACGYAAAREIISA